MSNWVFPETKDPASVVQSTSKVLTHNVEKLHRKELTNLDLGVLLSIDQKNENKYLDQDQLSWYVLQKQLNS